MQPSRDHIDPIHPVTVATLALTFGAWLATADDEDLHVAHLAADGRILAVGAAGGRADAASLPMRHVLAEALRLEAAGVVLAHNHPSGDPMPSCADVEATRSLDRAARQVGLRVLDHLVFGDGHWQSFRALGLL